MALKSYLTPSEAAKQYPVAKNTIYVAIREGQLDYIKTAPQRGIALDPDAIEEWLRRRSEEFKSSAPSY
jgi:excisionase family DNA binding protein|tara:strand:+ start:60 stop:266 length:207 start_codon:yes stop_codon:yes gene_type:complete